MTWRVNIRLRLKVNVTNIFEYAGICFIKNEINQICSGNFSPLSALVLHWSTESLVFIDELYGLILTNLYLEM